MQGRSAIRGLDGVTSPFDPEPWESWALCYGICLLCCWFRVLRSFYMSRLGLIVSIFFAMIQDVAQFIVVYAILVLAMSMLFLGVGDSSTIMPVCTNGTDQTYHEDGRLYLSCRPANFFLRTLFQSFGEFFLDDMKNDASVMFLILTFLILNIVLMNLLIAMMASTYETVLEQANSKRLEDKYYIIGEHARIAVAAPVPFNVVLIVIELIGFLWRYKIIHKRYPDCQLGRRVDLYLSRNIPAACVQAGPVTVADKNTELAISACMERARSMVLQEERADKERDGMLDLVTGKIEVIKKGMQNSFEQLGKSDTLAGRRTLNTQAHTPQNIRFHRAPDNAVTAQAKENRNDDASVQLADTSAIKAVRSSV